MAQITKQQYETQLQHIFRLLLENKTQEEIARELNISTRTVTRYSSRIDRRYGEVQRQKTDNTLFLECHLFKNRMLKLYKGLETHVLSDKTSGVEKARCAEIAASIALDVLKMESEGLRAAKELAAKKNNTFLNNNLRDDDDSNGPDINNRYHNHNQQQHQEQEEENDNRKF